MFYFNLIEAVYLENMFKKYFCSPMYFISLQIFITFINNTNNNQSYVLM